MGMTLSKANKKIAMQKAVDEMHKKIDNGLNKQHKDVMAWVLHTKRNFGTKRALETLLDYEDIWVCCGKRDMTGLTLDNVEAGNLAEMDIYIHTDGNIYDVGKGKGKDFVKDDVVDHKALFEFLKIKE